MKLSRAILLSVGLHALLLAVFFCAATVRPAAPRTDFVQGRFAVELAKPDDADGETGLAGNSGSVSKTGDVTPSGKPAESHDPAGGAAEAAFGARMAEADRLARNRPPAYPWAARRMRQQGRVALLLRIAPSGKVSTVSLVQSSGFPLLDRAALDQAGSWIFSSFPDQKEEMAIVQHIEFKMEGI